jgi:hypothetical protein
MAAGPWQAALEEMQQKDQRFVYEARLEPWGHTVARFVSPERPVDRSQLRSLAP